MTSKAKHMARSRRSHQAKRQIFGNFEHASRKNISRSGTNKPTLMDRLRKFWGGRPREKDAREETE